MICHVWKFCKDVTFGHVLFTDLYHYMRIFHALINLSINCYLNSFLSDSVTITWCVFNNNVFLSVSANEDLSAPRLGKYSAHLARGYN